MLFSRSADKQNYCGEYFFIYNFVKQYNFFFLYGMSYQEVLRSTKDSDDDDDNNNNNNSNNNNNNNNNNTSIHNKLADACIKPAFRRTIMIIIMIIITIIIIIIIITLIFL